MTRLASSGDASPSRTIPHPIAVETVFDPNDLTSLGIAISEILSSWDGSPNQMVICFHSPIPQLLYADLQRVFRFVHVLTVRLQSVDVGTHIQLDPAAHDEQTLNTLIQLFDAIVEHDETDGPVTVRIADHGRVPDNIKEAMFRREETGHVKFTGSDFGLFFSDTLVTEYRGDVWVEDNEPQAVVFVIETAR